MKLAAYRQCTNVLSPRKGLCVSQPTTLVKRITIFQVWRSAHSAFSDSLVLTSIFITSDGSDALNGLKEQLSGLGSVVGFSGMTGFLGIISSFENRGRASNEVLGAGTGLATIFLLSVNLLPESAFSGFGTSVAKPSSVINFDWFLEPFLSSLSVSSNNVRALISTRTKKIKNRKNY